MITDIVIKLFLKTKHDFVGRAQLSEYVIMNLFCICNSLNTFIIEVFYRKLLAESQSREHRKEKVSKGYQHCIYFYLFN